MTTKKVTPGAAAVSRILTRHPTYCWFDKWETIRMINESVEESRRASKEKSGSIVNFGSIPMFLQG